MQFLCRHIMPNGSRCQSPALHDAPYCYFHTRLHRQLHAQNKFADDVPLKFPVLEDRSAIQMALNQVFDALASSKLDARRAGLFLYGLTIASRNVDRRYGILQTTAVESVTQSIDGDDLAPVCRLCSSTDICAECPDKDTCKFYDPEDDDEEELKRLAHSRD